MWKTVFLWLLLTGNPALFLPVTAFADSVPVPEMEWLYVAPGLDLAHLAHEDTDKVLVTVLRIDPARYEFRLHSTLWDADRPLTTAEWAERFDLTAAINACMFLPDGQSPTAYLRRGEDSPSRSVASNYGGFFVSGPRRPGLPNAAILDKSVDDWEDLLPQYDTVIQNMRLLGADGEQLWPENGPTHSVAAIAQDRARNILFLHCRTQVNVNRLVRALLAHPGLALSRAVYVEGGSQTSLTLRNPAQTRSWTGISPAAFLFGNVTTFPLPTILGIRPKEETTGR